MLVWIASYPRSGNTFLRVLLNKAFGLNTYSIYNDPFDIGAESETAKLVGHTRLGDGQDFDALREATEVFPVKTHEYPPNAEDPAIYVIRDGRESSLSYANYRVTYRGDESIVESLEEVVLGVDPFGSWGRHVTQWAPDQRPNTLLLRFEDLVQAPRTHIERMSDFLDLKATESQLPTFQDLQKVNSKFFRKGSTRSWHTAFSDDLHTLFWLINYSPMSRYGYVDGMPTLLQGGSVHSVIRASLLVNDHLLRSLDMRRSDQNLIRQLTQSLNQRAEFSSNVRDQLSRQKALSRELRDRVSQARTRRNNLKQKLEALEMQALDQVRELKEQLAEGEAARRQNELAIKELSSKIEELEADVAALERKSSFLEIANSELSGTLADIAAAGDKAASTPSTSLLAKRRAYRALIELATHRNSKEA
jgi:hypothetical protein